MKVMVMKLGGIKPIQKHYTSKRNLTNYWVYLNSACHHGGKQEEWGEYLYSPLHSYDITLWILRNI